MSDRPFARIYYVDLERDYPKIYRDNDALSTYVRLLAVADAMWPSIPEVPRSQKAAIVKQLMDAGLVIPVPPFCYRIKGLDAERNARSNAASNAARSRWSNAPASGAGNAISSPVQPSPLPARSAPKKTLDERELSPEEYAQRVRGLLSKQTGVA